MDADRLAARLESTFDCDVHVLAKTSAARPSGAQLTTFGDVARTLRGRIRQFAADDGATFGGAVANTARYLVTVPRYSAVAEESSIVVVKLTDGRAWHYKLRVVGVRGPKSVYLADALACTVLSEGAA